MVSRIALPPEGGASWSRAAHDALPRQGARRPVGAWVLGAAVLVLSGCGSDPERPQPSMAQLQRPAPEATTARPIARSTDSSAPRSDLKTLTTPKETATTLERMAKRAAEEGDLPGAIQLYRRALALDPASLSTALALGGALYRADDYRGALEVYRQALRIEPGNPEAVRGQANTMIGLDRPRDAVEQFRSALARAPRDHRLANGLGVALDMTGDHRGAQQQYRAALALKPDDLNAHNNLGLSLALSGDYEQAVAQLARLVESPQSSARNRQNLALVYGLMGQPERAAEIGRMDLDDESVRRNLAYYEQLRTTSDRGRSSAVMKGKPEAEPAPSLPTLPSAAPAAAVETAPLQPPSANTGPAKPAPDVGEPAKSPPAPEETKGDQGTVGAVPQPDDREESKRADAQPAPGKPPAVRLDKLLSSERQERVQGAMRPASLPRLPDSVAD